MSRVPRRAHLAALLAVAPLAACAASQSHGHATAAGMPCSEAARVAQGALLRLGYQTDTVDAPKPGAPGRAVGVKNTGWSMATPEPGSQYTATVTMTCSNQGAEFDAVTDEPLPASLTFKSDFATVIAQVASRRVTRPHLAERPETGLVIDVEPLRGSAAAAEFGADLSAAGVTPVRLKIDNRTDRTYVFDGERVQLVTQEGERAAPLALDRVGTLTGPAQAAAREKRIAEGEIAPGVVRSGFLYFPASTYRRATLVLIDRETEEAEGFSVEF